MEKRLPLENVAAYNEAVSGIAHSKLEERAETNGSNTLGKRIRQSALEPFHFLQEDPKIYTTRRPSINLAQGNRYQKFGSRHNGQQSSAAVGMNSENVALLLLTKAQKQILRPEIARILAFKPPLNLLIRMAILQRLMMSPSCPVQRGAPHMVIVNWKEQNAVAWT